MWADRWALKLAQAWECLKARELGKMLGFVRAVGLEPW
jgi:hypothetical protein